MFSAISRPDERQDRVPAKEARSLRQHYDAERKLRLREAALAVAGPEPERDDAAPTEPYVPAGAWP